MCQVRLTWRSPGPVPQFCAAAFVSCLGGAPTPQSCQMALKECFVQRLLCLQPLSGLLATRGLGVFPALPMGKLLEEVK